MGSAILQPEERINQGVGFIRWHLALKLLLLAGATGYLAAYLSLAFVRCRYPYELEWIEGAMVDIVQRIVEGKSIYCPPALDFVPFLYPPGYFYLAAAAALVTGVGFLPLRLVSIGASLLSIACVYHIVRASANSRYAAWLAAGLFTATYRVTGAWLDIARVDSLFLACFLLFVVLLLHNPCTSRTLLAAGLCAGLAFLTKQTALVACLPVMLYLLLKDLKKGLLLLSSSLLPAGLVCLLLNQATGGWYNYYVFYLLSKQTEWIPEMFSSFWSEDLFFHLPVACLLGLYFFSGWFHAKDKQAYGVLFFILAGALASSFLTRVKIGGYDNVLLPMAAILALLFGLGLQASLAAIGRLPVHQRAGAAAVLYSACILQLVILFYNSLAQLPTPASRAAGDHLIELIASTPGEVYLPYHGHLPGMAGKKTYAHHSAIWDILRGEKDDPTSLALQDMLNQATRRQFFAMIILDTNWHYLPELDQYYARASVVFPNQPALMPVTGLQASPKAIYRPKVR